MKCKALGAFVWCLFLLVSTGVTALERGQECRGRNNVPGVCQLIYECRQALADIKAGLGKVLCKTGDLIDVVCCPTPAAPASSVTTRTPTIDLTRLRLSERKCHEYGELVFENVTVPVLIPGGQPIIRRTNKCGFKVVELIVGGTKAKAKEFPHMARLGYGELNDIQWSCGGAIISKRYILTAAHCVVTLRGQPTYVRIGDLNFLTTEDDLHSQTIRVTNAIPHPNYKSPQQYDDIALLELAEAMRFSQYSRPACLNAEFSIPERKAIAAGWGLTEFFGDTSEFLLKVTLDLFRFSDCQPSYEANRKLRQGLIESQQLCAGSHDSEKDTCEGDSGGPLQVYHGGLECMYKIVGVTSFGKGCGTAGLPGVYARISNYIDWIEANAFRYG